MRFHRMPQDLIPPLGGNAAWKQKSVYLPVIVGGEDTGHPCSRCQSPVAWGRRWCYQINQAVNADACKRVRRKSKPDAWAWIVKRLLERRRKNGRGGQPNGANGQGQKRAEVEAYLRLGKRHLATSGDDNHSRRGSAVMATKRPAGQAHPGRF
jgi:hypothetical protein